MEQPQDKLSLVPPEPTGLEALTTPDLDGVIQISYKKLEGHVRDAVKEAKDTLVPALWEMRKRYPVTGGQRTDLIPGIQTWAMYLEARNLNQRTVNDWFKPLRDALAPPKAVVTARDLAEGAAAARVLHQQEQAVEDAARMSIDQHITRSELGSNPTKEFLTPVVAREFLTVVDTQAALLAVLQRLVDLYTQEYGDPRVAVQVVQPKDELEFVTLDGGTLGAVMEEAQAAAV